MNGHWLLLTKFHFSNIFADYGFNNSHNFKYATEKSLHASDYMIT